MKNLNTILDAYKYFSVASASDNPGILEFFKTVTMDTKTFSLRYDRGADFFEFSREQSEHCTIFIIKDEKGIIRGCASIALIPHLINGRKETCAYLGDLRISPLLNAKIRILWRKCYGEIIANFNQLEEFLGVNFLYSAILDENQNAMRSLLKNNDQLFYHELTSYQTFNVFAPKLFSPNTSSKYLFEEPRENEIRKFLSKRCKGLGMHNYILINNDANDELKRRLENWNNFSINSFLTIKNQSGEIVAVTAPWICQSKKLVIEKMSIPLKVFGILLPFLKIPIIKEKEPIKTLYLTHLTFSQNLSKYDREEILQLILTRLLKSKNRNFHFISFFVFPKWELGSLPFYSQKTNAKFYQVMSKKQHEGGEYFDLKNEVPAFEIGIS